jgi:hypothetical protein
MENKNVASIKSEPIKWLPIGISSLALLISFLSWREAHQGRLLNEAVNRPVVTVDTKGNVIASAIKEGSTETVKMLFVTSEIKNIGKTSAIITKIDHKIKYIGPCELGYDILNSINGAGFEPLVGKEVVPNLSLRATEGFSIPPGCEKKKIALGLSGTIQYTDTISGVLYVQDFFKYVSVPDPTPSPSSSP